MPPGCSASLKYYNYYRAAKALNRYVLESNIVTLLWQIQQEHTRDTYELLRRLVYPQVYVLLIFKIRNMYILMNKFITLVLLLNCLMYYRVVLGLLFWPSQVRIFEKEMCALRLALLILLAMKGGFDIFCGPVL